MMNEVPVLYTNPTQSNPMENYLTLKKTKNSRWICPLLALFFTQKLFFWFLVEANI